MLAEMRVLYISKEIVEILLDKYTQPNYLQ